MRTENFKSYEKPEIYVLKIGIESLLMTGSNEIPISDETYTEEEFPL